jgi:hypothetical protein
MGVGMQIVYQGFAGSAALEAEAGAQLVRLERFCGLLGGCHLAIEALHSGTGRYAYDARLDLVMRNGTLKPVERCVGEDAKQAIRRAFIEAEQVLTAMRDGDDTATSGRVPKPMSHVRH